MMHIDMLNVVSTAGQAAEHAPPNFFMSRFYETNVDSIQEIDPNERVADGLDDIVQTENGRLKEKLGDFNENIGEIMSKVILTPIEASIQQIHRELERTPEIWVFQNEQVNDPIIMFQMNRVRGRRRRGAPRRSSRITTTILLGDNKEHILSFYDYFKSEIDDIKNMVGQFVELESLKHGDDMIKDYLDNKATGEHVDNWYTEPSDDDFEKEVFEAVNEITSLCLPNVNVELELGENPEYDIVSLPIGRFGTSYAIEVKNYDRDEIEEADNPVPDNLRYRLITQPKEEAERVDLNLITVVKGLEDDQYENLERHAGPSDVVLLNEDNYRERLRDSLIDDSIEKLMERIS